MIADYKAKEAAKAAKAKNDKTGKDKDESTAATAISSSPVTSVPTTPAVAASASHRKFALHRSMFDMRKAELRRREQGAKAKEVSKGEFMVVEG